MSIDRVVFYFSSMTFSLGWVDNDMSVMIISAIVGLYFAVCLVGEKAMKDEKKS